MTKPHISLRSSFVASASGSLTYKSILSRSDGDPTGIRTRIWSLKGSCPNP